MTPLQIITLINDFATTGAAAMQAVSTLTPLYQRAMGGEPVSDDEVGAALAGLDTRIASFDEHIARAKAAT
jgi:hypothetical protein